MEGAGEEVESMEDTVFVSDSGLGEVVVAEFDSVGEEKGFGCGVDDVEVTVVLKGTPDVETIMVTEGPGLGRAGLVVDDDSASNGANGSYVKVEGDVAVFPGRYFRSKGGLTKEIKGEFDLR